MESAKTKTSMLALAPRAFCFVEGAYLRDMVQFCGCRGSSGPSYSTTYSSFSGRSGGYGFPPPKFGKGF